jgi:hypothetical protein
VNITNHLTFREAVFKDIEALSEIHIAALPCDLLPKLGKAFLSEIFYPSIFDDQKNTIILAECNKDKTVVGLIVFSINQKKIFINIIKKFLTKPIFLFNSNLFVLLKEILVSVGSQFKQNSWNKIQNIPEIYVFAIDKLWRGKKVGSCLWECYLESRKNISEVIVKTSDPGAKIFYEKNHFFVIGKEKRAQRELYVLKYEKKPK